MSSLDPRDPAALEAALEALPEGTEVEVEVAGEELVLVRVPGGWHLPGDVVVASGDVADGRPTRVEVLDDGPWADFFRWVPAGRYLADDDPGNTEMSRTVVVAVDGDLVAEYRATVLPPGPTPPRGTYVVRWDGEGRVYAERVPATDTDAEALALLADVDPAEAAELAAYREERRRARGEI